MSIQNDDAWPRAGLNAKKIHYFRVPKGREVFREGDEANAIFHVELGCIRLEVERDDGEQDVVGFLFKNDTFSPGVSKYWASAHAVTDSLLSCVPLSSRWAGPADARTPVEFAPDQLARDIVHGLSFIRRLPANARLFWFLKWLNLRTGPRDTNIVELPMTGRDLASFLGVAPETVSRGFAELERQGRLRRLRPHQIELSAGPH